MTLLYLIGNDDSFDGFGVDGALHASVVAYRRLSPRVDHGDRSRGGPRRVAAEKRFIAEAKLYENGLTHFDWHASLAEGAKG